MTTPDPTSTSVFVAPSLTASPAFGRAPTGGRRGPFTEPDAAELAATHRVHSGPEDLTEFHEVPVATLAEPPHEPPARTTEPITAPSEAELLGAMEAHIASWAGPRVGSHGVRRSSAHSAALYAVVPVLGVYLMRSHHPFALGRLEDRALAWAQEHAAPGPRQDGLRETYLASFRRDLEFLDRHARVALSIFLSLAFVNVITAGFLLPLTFPMALGFNAYQAIRAARGETFQR